MQILIANQAFNGFEAGDIIAAVPDSHVWGREESVDVWVAAGNLAGDFPNPSFSIVQLDEEPCDLNLAEADIDVESNMVARRTWRLNLSLLPPGDVAQLTPGAVVSLNRASTRARIRDKHGNRQLPPDASNNGNQIKRRPETKPVRRPVTVPAVKRRRA